jgi:DNA repair ATPase RecN
MVAVRQLQDEMPARFGRMERIIQEQDSVQAIDRLEAEVNDLRAEQQRIGDRLSRELRSDLGGMVGELADANRMTLDRLGNLSSELDRDRLQRLADFEQLVDSMSAGWEGLYGSMSKLFDSAETVEQRMMGIERRLEAVRDLERTVDEALVEVREQLQSHLSGMQRYLSDLQPAPVTVTVNHPEAQVTNTTRSGFLPRSEQD